MVESEGTVPAMTRRFGVSDLDEDTKVFKYLSHLLYVRQLTGSFWGNSLPGSPRHVA